MISRPRRPRWREILCAILVLAAPALLPSEEARHLLPLHVSQENVGRGIGEVGVGFIGWPPDVRRQDHVRQLGQGMAGR
jgi:hypothetical protein